MAITSTTIDIKWCPLIDEQCVSHYDIYNADGDVYIGTTDSEDFEYTVGGLTPLTTYTFYVIGVDCSGNESQPSNDITATTLDGPAVEIPSDVVNFAYANVGETDVDLSWDAATFPLTLGGYNIYHSDGVTLFHQTVGAGLTYEPNDLDPGTNYSLKMKAYDTVDAESANFSNTISFLTDPQSEFPPTDPANLVVGVITETTIALSWDNSTFQHTGSYDVYQDDVLIKSVIASDTIMTGLTPNTQYSFKVQAVDVFNELKSGFSNTVTPTTIEIQESFLNLGAITSVIGSNPNITWLNPDNILTPNSQYATCDLFGLDVSRRLNVDSFGFMTSGTIVGVEVHIQRKSDSSGVNKMTVSLSEDGTLVGTPKTINSQWNSGGQLIILGGSDDLWGLALTPAIVDHDDFGVSVYDVSKTIIIFNDVAQIDYIKMLIYYTT